MIFIISDIHSRLARLKKQINHIEQSIGRALSETDVIIVLGDLLYANKSKILAFSSFPQPTLKNDLITIGFLSMLPCQILVVLGNHETSEKLSQLNLQKSQHFGGTTYDYNSNIFFCKNGEIYTIPSDDIDYTFLAIGTAYGHGLPLLRQQSNITAPHIAHACKISVGASVDYVITHDGPVSAMHPRIKTLFGTTAVNRIFESFKNKVKFKAWIYGHQHIDYDVGKFFCIYNRILCINDSGLCQLN